MSASSDLAAALDRDGLTVAAPTEHPLHGMTEARWIAPRHLVRAAEAARSAGFFFESMTCIDRLEPHGVFELLYTFNRYDELGRTAFRVWAPKDEPVPSLAGVYGIAEWNEREAWEFFGVTFSGHPHLTWLLLPEETGFRPLLKSFTAPPPSEYDDSLSDGVAPAP